MISLRASLIPIRVTESAGKLFTVSTNHKLPERLRSERVFISRSGQAPPGFGGALFVERKDAEGFSGDAYLMPPELEYLSDGDIVRLNGKSNACRVLYRASVPHTSILVTEQCNHYCLMCSQPPKDYDDSWIVREIQDLIPRIPRDAREISFTGGEPTLLGPQFLAVLKLTKAYLPHTAVHILSNGRAFRDLEFAKQYAGVEHPDLMVGIPVYSDDPVLHDYIVQSPGALSETIQGILNLKSLGQRVEIRVVIHKLSLPRLVQTAEFIARNLLFVDHVALMGLEITGFTRANLEKLWVDPYDYKDVLSNAVKLLEGYGLRTSVFNHQLCVVNRDVSRAYRKSISDWKNEYLDECSSCARKSECGGFFTSGRDYRFSDHIRAF